MILRPEDVWPVDDEFADVYRDAVARGRRLAGGSGLNVVAIARNAMHRLGNTLALVDEVRASFARFQMFVFENDSTDGTAAALDGHASRNGWFHVSHDSWGGTDSRGFERARTERLARARNICLDWVAQNGRSNEYTVVLDMDPEHGFSPDGILNSIGWLETLGKSRVGAMASYSFLRVQNPDGSVGVAHADAWPARLNWWRDRREELGGMQWFLSFFPPVGSMPIPMNSAFGGLGVYLTEAFLTGGYSGEDCEHVPHHRRMAQARWGLCLNPGCRYITIWQ